MMRGKKLRVGLMVSLPWGLYPPVAHALQQWDFVTPCVNALTCTGPPMFRICWCETDWNDCNAWQEVPACNPQSCLARCYPQTTLDYTTIEHSDAGACSGSGAACSDDSDCPVGETCDNKETKLVLSLTNETINLLTIKTKSTPGAQSTIQFESKGVGAKTLHIAGLTLDASNGDVAISVTDNATLTTN